jgi:hypothetical protein
MAQKQEQIQLAIAGYVRPAHADLENVVKIEKRYRSWNQYPAPNDRVGFVKCDFKRKNFRHQSGSLKLRMNRFRLALVKWLLISVQVKDVSNLSMIILYFPEFRVYLNSSPHISTFTVK